VVSWYISGGGAYNSWSLMCCRITLCAVAMITCASAADIDPVTLLERVRAKVLASAQTVPRYVCRQSLVRQTYATLRKPSQACGTLSEARPSDPSHPDAVLALSNGIPGFTLISADRARLDVMIADGVELFSWPGGGKFQTNNPDDLLGGGFAGNGDFASFIITAFTSGQTNFEYVGSCGSASCVRYRYDVPVGVSRYVVENPVEKVQVGYHGSIDIDAESATLLAATVIPTGLSERMRVACDVRTRMTYVRAALNASEFTIPQTAEKEYLDAEGWYFSNWIQYTGCRQYSAESTLRFGDDQAASVPDGQTAQAAAAMPRRGATLELRLATKLDSDLSSAGDRVEATLVRAVPASRGRMIPAGSVVSGHLAQVEKTYSPKPKVKFAIRFDTIVVGGKPMPVAVFPTGKMDGRGHGVFTFSQPRVALDSKFVTRWRVH
jgi:hypothetical protein